MRTKLDEICQSLKIEIRSDETSAPRGYIGSSEGTHWDVTLIRRGESGAPRKLRTPFHQGSAHTKPPTAASVLYCLISDADAGSETFEDFCSNFGSSTDSRRALDMYLTCQGTAAELRKFLGEHMTAIREAAQEY